MYKSELLFLKWLKEKGYKDYSRALTKGFPDFIVFFKGKMVWVECKRYIYNNKPLLSMLKLEQKKWIIDQPNGYLFFSGGADKKGSLYQYKKGFINVKDFK